MVFEEIDLGVGWRWGTQKSVHIYLLQFVCLSIYGKEGKTEGE
jgi:hypothetical protein